MSRAESLCVGLFAIAFIWRASSQLGISVDQTDSWKYDNFSSKGTQQIHVQQSREKIAQREATLVEQFVCSRHFVDSDVEELRFCRTSARNEGHRRIVGLVEVRNVGRAVRSFLEALSRTVDAIIVLDDHSSDESRNEILLFNFVYGGLRSSKDHGTPGRVEMLLRKVGVWEREELRDRELLLAAGRRYGGTHFVLLDYDEYLSASCVDNEFLRESILALLPGESLYLPWVELWKSTALQRVRKGDKQMNFLTRRQIVIFADDGKFNYTMESSIARKLGHHRGAHESTIHALRCPRSICPPPSKYRGPKSDVGYPSSVKRLRGCYIIEARFLNMNNVLLKSAWYEALGRVMGAPDAVTRGKMIEKLFPRQDFAEKFSSLHGAVPGEEVAISRSRPEWLHSYTEFSAGVYDQVELWRADELLHWLDEHGSSFFDGLEALNRIDLPGMRNALAQVRSRESAGLIHVPRVKQATLVVVMEPLAVSIPSSFLRHLGWTEVQLRTETISTSDGIRLSSVDDDVLDYERWKAGIERQLYLRIRESRFNAVFLSIAARSRAFQFSLLELLRNEFPHLHVTILFGNWAQSSASEVSAMLPWCISAATEAGSHMRVLDVPLESFGSFAVLVWLRRRLSRMSGHQFGAKENTGLVEFAELTHQSLSKVRGFGMNPAPVSKLIFSLNVGRSGSKYLADILGSVSNPISAQHEPRCTDGMCSGGGAVRMQNRSLSSSYELRRAIKLPMIRAGLVNIPDDVLEAGVASTTCACESVTAKLESEQYSSVDQEHSRPLLEVTSTSGCTLQVVRDVVYAETNPNFKSWFYDVVLDNFPKNGYSVTVVVVRKYIAAVVKSLYETGYFTSRDGYNWMETSASVNSRLRATRVADDSQLDVFEKLTSYVLNAEATFRDIMKRYGAGGQGHQRLVTFVETRSERMFGRQGTLEVLRRLGLRASGKTVQLAGEVADKYRRGRRGLKRRSFRTSLTECERRVYKLVREVSESNPEVLDYAGALEKVQGFEYAQ